MLEAETDIPQDFIGTWYESSVISILPIPLVSSISSYSGSSFLRTNSM